MRRLPACRLPAPKFLCVLPPPPPPPPRPPPAQDCSIDVLPMTDPSPDCSEPLTETPNYKYGQLQLRMFYQSTDTIRSVLPSDEFARHAGERGGGQQARRGPRLPGLLRRAQTLHSARGRAALLPAATLSTPSLPPACPQLLHGRNRGQRRQLGDALLGGFHRPKRERAD